MRTPSTPTAPHPVNLALQGGGSHGAFTWGVLDALLDDPRLRIEGLSGTSAGAVNAVALAHGFAKASQTGADPRAGARESLARIWQEIVALGSLGTLPQNLLKLMTGGLLGEQAQTYTSVTDLMSHWMSPYQANPLDINPLRGLLEREIDFAALARLESPKVFISATHVNSGKAEIFEGRRLTAQAVMASACLPLMYQAVEIDGEHYWDGGYSGNPALTPLISECASRDLILVQINPIRRDATPGTPADILDRINELTFNASLLSQMRSIDFINRLLDDGRLKADTYRKVLLHRIDGGEALEQFPASTKTSTDGAMIRKLFELGQQNARRWLRHNFDALGRQGTVNIRRDYLDDMRMSGISPASSPAPDPARPASAAPRKNGRSR